MTDNPASASTRPLRVITPLLVITALYLGRDVLIPAAMAVLLTFLLNPVVNRLRRWGLPRVASVAVAIASAAAISLAIGYLVAQQSIDLTSRLPDYRDNLRQKVRDLRSSGNGKLARISGTLDELKHELATSQPSTQPAAAVARGMPPGVNPPNPAPVRVEVVNDGPDFGSIATAIATPLFVPITGFAITGLLTIFLLLNSDDIRERLITFAGMRQLSLTTSALDEAATRIGGFLRMQAAVNAIYGAMVAIGLLACGVPNALLWGVLACLLRFVPYLGPWISAIMPTLLAFAVFPGWTRPIGVIVMFSVVEFVTNMILEPWLYGSSAGITSLGVVVAAVFWAWVWGPVGMILAVPITACLVVMGKYVPQLSLLHQLFGSDVTVPLISRLYQRLLVGDELSSTEIVAEHIETSSFAQACDKLLLPALSELKRDVGSGLIHTGQMLRAIQIIDDIIDDGRKEPSRSTKLICIAGQNEVDACAARLLAHAARLEGISTEAISSDVLANEAADRAHVSGATWVAIVQVPPVSLAHSKRLFRAFSLRLAEGRQLIDVSFGVRLPPSKQSDRAQRPSTTPVDNVRREHAISPLLSHLKEQSSVSPSATAARQNIAPVSFPA